MKRMSIGLPRPTLEPNSLIGRRGWIFMSKPVAVIDRIFAQMVPLRLLAVITFPIAPP